MAMGATVSDRNAGVLRQLASGWLLPGLGRMASALAPAPLAKAPVRGIAVPIRPPARRHLPDAEEIYRGIFTFAGHRVQTAGRIIFDVPESHPEWLRALHGFSWLKALLREDVRLWHVQARTLVQDWARRRRRHPPVARAPMVAAERLTMLVALAPALLKEAPAPFEKRLFRLLSAEFRQLHRQLPFMTRPHERLLALLALTTASLSLQGLNHALPSLGQRLAEELERQILPDGAHISRSPARLLEIVARLQPLHEAWRQAGVPVSMPDALDTALQRALPMLRFFRLGDGGLALFQGVSDPAGGQLAAVLEADATGARPLCHATHAGFARLAAGRAVLVADIGRPAPALVNADAALSTLAFEFSYGATRIITSCGAPRLPSPEWRRATRFTAAHSAPTLSDRNAGHLTGGRLARRILGGENAIGPRRIAADMADSARGLLLEASHDAWQARAGLRCHRRLFLAADGHDLRGEDALIPEGEGSRIPEGEELVIRFHLHPSVKPTLSRDGCSVLLALPDRTHWRFTARGGTISIEESVYLPAEEGLCRTCQIVLRAPVQATGTRISWKLALQPHVSSAARRRKTKVAEAPALPL